MNRTSWIFSLALLLSHHGHANDDTNIIVAIIDDGFVLSHETIAPHLLRNLDEIEGNQRDDDGNGYIDDLVGWDVADHDPDVVPHPDVRQRYYHGTYIASVFLKTLKTLQAVEPQSTQRPIKILPVKAVSDQADIPYITSGFDGIEYAMSMNADIILCAYSGSEITPSQKKLLAEAYRRNIMIIGSAGNYLTEEPQYPAAFPTVLAVAGVDEDNRKIPLSNWAPWVDLSAPGKDIVGAASSSNTATQTRSGTSPAAAYVAAHVAILRTISPSMSIDDIEHTLKSQSLPIENQNPTYAGFLGAGRVQLKAFHEQPQSPVINQPEGFMKLSKKATSVKIELEQEYSGIQIGLREGNVDGSVRIYEAGKESRLLASVKANELKRSIFIPNSNIRIEFDATDEHSTLLLGYEAHGIQKHSRYCQGTIDINASGTFSDGSGPNQYAHNSSCKWLITAPEGQHVRITFDSFDTQPKIDQLFFFNGSGTHEAIMAIFTGQEPPPELVTWQNQVLVWFVSDDSIAGQGFSGKIEFVAKPDS